MGFFFPASAPLSLFLLVAFVDSLLFESSIPHSTTSSNNSTQMRSGFFMTFSLQGMIQNSLIFAPWGGVCMG